MIKYFKQLFKKKPKVVSLNDLVDKIKKWCDEHNETYYSVVVEYRSTIVSSIDKYPNYRFGAYVNNYGYHYGATPDEVLEKLNLPKEVENKVLDVDILID